jgi:prepilin-type N-terminal cleavage/methylation domain-containing protein
MNVLANKPQRTKGFTIVELLIVIVVIAILASISVVAYNGVQQRSKNSQTASALQAWVKGLKLYKAQNGQWPNGWTCLGENYKYGEDGNGTSGAQCRSDHSQVTSQPAFHTMMRPFMSSFPTLPDTTWSNGTDWYRGLMYAFAGGDGTQVYIIATYAGEISCPVITGITSSVRHSQGNAYCNYLVGYTTGA